MRIGLHFCGCAMCYHAPLIKTEDAVANASDEVETRIRVGPLERPRSSSTIYHSSKVVRYQTNGEPGNERFREAGIGHCA